MKKDYEVGYGKTNMADDLLNELQQAITITDEAGKKKKITKQQTLAKSLVDQALAGSSKALSLVWASVKQYGWDKPPEDGLTFTVTKEDMAALEAFLDKDDAFKLPGESGPIEEPTSSSDRPASGDDSTV
jgi:hypothetical protein